MHLDWQERLILLFAKQGFPYNARHGTPQIDGIIMWWMTNENQCNFL